MEVLRLARENISGEDTAAILDFPIHREIANRMNPHREAVTLDMNELSPIWLSRFQSNRIAIKSGCRNS
jgi:hypothetical protein